MRKVFCLFTFLLCTSALFAQETMYTEEGSYIVDGTYLANTQGGGQQIYEKMWNDNTLWSGYTKSGNVKLTKGQWECVHRVLNRYDTTRGDIYYVSVRSDRALFMVIVEFTSETEYSYWLMQAR